MNGEKIMDKKYIGTSLALSKSQTVILEKVRTEMQKELMVKLSRSNVVQRLLNLYMKNKL